MSHPLHHSILTHFAGLKDPRQCAKVLYPLTEICCWRWWRQSPEQMTSWTSRYGESSSTRSRFVLKVEGFQTGSSTERPTNQREQQVVIEVLHQLALGADRVEGLDQQGPEQTLGRDRGAASEAWTASN